MKVSLQWLREWVQAGDDIAGLAHALTMAGLEIEGMERAGPPLEGVVVGEVRSVARHPDAEKLNVCRVWDGKEELQIVCGAPNVRAGMKAPLARIGAKLPNGTEIKKAKLRGVESFGMLCSARELALSEDTAGLMDLDPGFAAGESLASALKLDDTLLEVKLTPNRGDCMSVMGIAREVAVARSTTLTPPKFTAAPVAIRDTFPVRVESAGCPKLAGRVIRGIRANASSPAWMQERLRRAGVRPISAAVDVTNYVMLELGQPMHAYDLRRLDGAVVARMARAGEKLTLLDGRTVDLAPDVLVIADERSLIGMAGVMGGEASGIDGDTTDVFLESAFFDPAAIAGRGRRYGLVTDASQRFERGVDPQLQEHAIERATQLLIESAGGTAGPIAVARSDRPIAAVPAIRLRHRRVQHVLGAQIPVDLVADLLTRLGMKVAGDKGEWQVTPPSWRFDIRIEEDLIEEIARLYGFDNIPAQDAAGTDAVVPWTETRVRNDRASDLLVDRGYHEAIAYSFTDAAWQGILFPDEALALANPISAELGAMRVSLWPGLLQAVRDNHRRQRHRVRLFEIGRRFAKDGSETEVIAGVATGSVVDEQWGVESAKVDFFDVKADLEALIALTGAREEFRFTAERHPALHPGQSARVWRGERPVGWIGAIHPQHLPRLDLTYPAFVFELETAHGLAARVPQFEEISKYPAIRRDIAVIVDEGAEVQALESIVRTTAGPLLKHLTVLSVYRGRQFEKGKKSIALGMQLQDTSRTLTDRDADTLVAQVVDQLGRHAGGKLRDQ
jgi:phenylalanyl-tRNA synthetase beta chain